MGKYNIFIDADNSREIIDDNIPARDEREALEYYKSKNVEKFKKFLENLPKKYNNKDGCFYEEKDAVHIKSLYYNLINDKKEKELAITALENYINENIPFDKEIMIYIAYNLTKFYKKKAELAKLYSFILERFFDDLYYYKSDSINEFPFADAECALLNETIIPIVIEAVEWVENNLKVDYEKKKILNYIVYMSIENMELNKLNDTERNNFFRRYTKAIWELREHIDLKDIFGPLLEGIGWSYVNLNSKNDKDIINYFINSGIEENIAKELFESIFSENQTKDN
jgi:hypothetical protein